MDFTVEQHLAAPVETVERVLTEAAWYEAVAAGATDWEPTLLAVDDQGDRVDLRVRYRFRGSLNPAARRVLDQSRLAWVEESCLDRRTHRVDLRIVPESYGDKLSFAGGVELVAAASGGATLRRLTATVKVRAPLVAGRVERAIVEGLERHARVEEAAFAPYVSGSR